MATGYPKIVAPVVFFFAQADAVVPDELLAEDEGFGKTVRGVLHFVGEGDTQSGSVTEKETIRVDVFRS